MKGRSLLALAVLSLALACEGNKLPTGPTVPMDPSKIISDGAHSGGNKDFFFLPPLVPLPLHNPDFELGKFNNALGASLRIEICELNPEPLPYGTGLPTITTACNPAKSLVGAFGAGTLQPIKLVNLPLRQFGWWTLFGLPADGFYYVLWDPRQSNPKIDVNKYYRIKVLVAGTTEPLGFADVDPMSSLAQWKYSLTGKVVQMVNGVLLPIPFRVEKGEFCEGASLCTSVTVINNSPTPQFVRVQGNAGPIAGVKVPEGKWLPDGGPQSVVFTIKQVNTGDNHGNSGTQEFPCHPDLPLQQFNACFHFSTIPVLAPIPAAQLPAGGELGDQFLKYITTTVCFVLADKVPPDTREPWVQLWASDVDESPRPLPSAYADDIMPIHSEQNCGTNYDVIASNSGGVTGLASAGWRNLKGGLGRLFGVKTAYAVDLGLGGITKKISNIGPALTAEIRNHPYLGSTNLTLETVAEGDLTTYVTARIVGTQKHDAAALADVTFTGKTRGLPGLPVTFTTACLPSYAECASSGTISVFEGSPSTHLTVTSSDYEDSSLSGGFASVIWTLPNEPGTYYLTANGQAIGGPLVYTATVVAAALPDLIVSSGPLILAPSIVPSSGGIVGFSGWTVKNQGAAAVGATNNGYYLSTDPIITTADLYLGGSTNPALGAGQSFNWEGLNFLTPRLAVGTYYIGILVENPNDVAESNEGNNYVSAPFLVRQVIDFERYPSGVGVCDGLGACPVTNEFASSGVVFSFSPNAQGQTPSLCQTTHGPIGEGSNYGVTPLTGSVCQGWAQGVVTMTFASYPTTVWFELTGNNGVVAGPFPTTAFDAEGNEITVGQWSGQTYTDQFGNTMRRELRRVDNPNGIARIEVNEVGATRFIDNLLIVP